MITMKPSRNIRTIDSIHNYKWMEKYLGHNLVQANYTRLIQNIQHEQKGTVSPELIARHWNIGLKAATNTYNSTTQLGVRDYTKSVGTRGLKHMVYQLKHRYLRCPMYTHTLVSELKSLTQNTCVQIFIMEFHWTCFYLL